ncbi:MULTISPECIES: sensor histidine kinase [unclassified Streptomyces]|uniref:sensor histidine kinase n=1 Tax=unclassified Streptomyces TaxID=2593676 RepID=UPI0007ED2265|nr:MULTISPECIES: HAMP domain-containing sensor histidine kinase [unclassified Streptomyces]MCP3769977.1 HAMP domain-containing histidine kinase [Streptomyces sp. MAR25Y5]OBQ46744.1 two-component sensor histidine kinase [Streptomyces sp. H-KF8]
MRRTAARRIRGLSLRDRLLVITLLLLVAALLGSTGLVLDQLRRGLVGQLDERVGAVAAVTARLPDLPRAVGEDAPRVRETVEQQWVRDVRVAYLSPAGRVERVIGSGAGGPPDLPRLDTAAVAGRGGEPFTARGTDGGADWRVLAVPRVAGRGAGDGGSVVAAGSLGEVDDAMKRLTGRVLLVDAAVLVLLGLAGWFAVRAGLRPLGRIENTAAAIAGGDLSSRVPELAAAHTELGRLSAALNGMLDRIEEGDAARADTEQRMRRFIADASHELRTPLSGIKGFTELYRMGGMPERADVDASMGRIEREAGRLADLVEELLLLARLDEHDTAALPLRLTPMDLRTLAADALHDLRALDPGRPVALTGPGGGPPGAAPVLGDEARLRQVTSNLVGNAVAHTPSGTPVRIGVGAQDGHAVLEFQDEGPGMTSGQAERAFDRFYRADKARARARAGGGGAGLGLAIVHSLVRTHGGHVEVRTAPDRGATFRVLLPLDPGVRTEKRR